MDTRLTRKERLRGKSAIDRLFSKGKSFVIFPLRIVYFSEPATEDSPAMSLLVSVSKKRFKRAVKRNKVKRYKKNISAQIIKDSGQQVHLAILYLDKEIPEYHTLENRMEDVLKRLARELCKPENV